ncbi:serpin-like protein [Nosema bombycis CQ1]|uniref:Serpin-like protein n=1 Tax=Nosema bombycis (strain CQ1 / CVCC 102059) TaxID=578461 RepID=R0MMP9_NOSB1|nr:serpin-like protein [Nosema bombycis CQ1]|eukprot:EOB14148.1 serpin-like protein [Nosema bombycis CQ1]
MQHDFKRYMVYLIPSEHDTSLSNLWDEFYTFSEGKIKNLISKLKRDEVDLHIPKVEKLESKFELMSLLQDVFKYHTAFGCSSTMMTYINVDENGTEATALMGTTCVDGCLKIPYVAAKRPYVSFVFDMHSERILFITKDTGVLKN